MISVSDKFVSIMNSNIRPKADFKIEVTKKDASIIKWTSKDITNFTFKRGIDPVGRNLPFLELTWEEIYLGELDTNNEAIKYNEIEPFLKVRLTIEQSLSFINTWQDVYKYTWNDLFSNGMTWRDVLKKPQTEVIEMPMMFLVGKPEVKDQKIRWTARDFLYFLNSPQEIGFESGINFSNIPRYFLLSERANFKDNNFIINAISQTQANLYNESALNFAMSHTTLFSDTTKNILKNILASANYFLNFGTDGDAKPIEFSAFFYPGYNTPKFTGDIIKSYPRLTKGKDISSFSFSQYNVKLDEENKYTLSTPDESFTIGSSTTVNRFFYKDFGKIEINSSNENSFLPKTINKNALTVLNSLNIIPASLNSAEIFINNEKDGEQFVENNNCNFFNSQDILLTSRKSILNSWFSRNYYTMEFEGLPMFHLEPNDYVRVDTNLFENGVRVKKYGLILEQELTFNGAFNQKTIVREV
jgi:hypothetical protein